jgi:hypothetical protein
LRRRPAAFRFPISGISLAEKFAEILVPVAVIKRNRTDVDRGERLVKLVEPEHLAVKIVEVCERHELLLTRVQRVAQQFNAFLNL